MNACFVLHTSYWIFELVLVRAMENTKDQGQNTLSSFRLHPSSLNSPQV